MAESESVSDDRLDSWKAIAAYLDRDVSTVRRWEKSEGMPVHRHRHAARGSAYAYKSELSRWFEGRRTDLEQHEPAAPASIADDSLAAAPNADETATAGAPARATAARSSTWRRIGWVAGAVAALLALVAVGYLSYRAYRPTNPPATFQARDWILVGDIENRTGDPRLDGTIAYALERELNESRFVNVAPRERVDDTLRLMKKPLDTSIDRATGLEIALRDGGIRAVLTGRVEKFGDTYALSTLVVDSTDQGRALTASNVRVSDESKILDAVHDLSDRIRRDLGETPGADENPVRLERVTTGSLEALKLYTEGMRAVNQRDWPTAAAFLQQASVKEAGFASAEILLAHCLRNMQRPSQEYLAHARRAADVAEQTSDRERYFILGSFAEMAGDDEKAEANYKALVRLYPDDFWGWNNLRNIYGRTGRQDESWQLSIDLVALRPNDFRVSVSAAMVALSVGRPLDEVKTLAVRARQLDATGARPFERAFLDLLPTFEAWVLSDIPSVIHTTGNLRDKSQLHKQPAGLFNLAIGRLAAAEEAFQHVTPEGDREILLGLTALLRGDRKAAGLHVSRARRLPRNHQSLLVWLMFQTGDLPHVEPYLLREWVRIPGNTNYLMDEQVINAELQLTKGKDPRDVAAAIKLARRGYNTASASYFRACEAEASVLLQAGDLSRAASVLEEATEPRSKTYLTGELFPGLFWLGDRALLARVYRQMGRIDDAGRIDAEIAKLLAYADPDFCLLP
jgi:tetratricopeptide (TPR) repeat protein